MDDLKNIIAQLKSHDWLTLGRPLTQLRLRDDAPREAFEPVFELTFHHKRPIACHSCCVMLRFGRHAVPFLYDQAVSRLIRRREMALTLLMETGQRWATSVLLIAQNLEDRRPELPDWGMDPKVIFSLFHASLLDSSRSVRFVAACALEEFGQYLSELVPVFVDCLTCGTSHQQNWAALHLGRMGETALPALPALRVATHSKHKYTALAAANAIQRISTGNSFE